MYHTATERSEFYSMVNRDRPPILFTPTEDPEKAALEFGTELPRYNTKQNAHSDISLYTYFDHLHSFNVVFHLKISFYSSRNSPPPASLTPGPTNSILKLNGNPGDGDNGASMLTPVSIFTDINRSF